MAIRAKRFEHAHGRSAAVKPTDAALFRRLLWQARPCWPHITALFLLGLVATPVALLAPLPDLDTLTSVEFMDVKRRVLGLLYGAGAEAA